MAKKILIFSLTYDSRFLGGAEVAIREITNRIPESDIEFHLITLRFDSNLPKTEKVGNILVHRIGFTKNDPTVYTLRKFPLHYNKYLYAISAFIKAVRLHKRNNYDAIWSMMASYNSFAALFFKIKYPNIPFILSLQEGDPIEYIKKRVGIFYFLFEKIFKKADIIQSISNYLAKFAKDMGFSDDVKVIPNAVDFDLFSKKVSDEELEQIKMNLGKIEKDIFLITTSRLVKKNAVDDIIRSLIFLPTNVRLLIIGQGDDEFTLRKLADENGLSQRVDFLGYMQQKDIPKFLKASDIFIRPSLSEGMGNSFVEAMAAEVPVIATPVGGIVDFLFDPDKNQDKRPTGLFCEVRNPKSIADQVKRYLENPALRGQIIIEAKKLVQSVYDWDIVSRRMREEVIGKALAK